MINYRQEQPAIFSAVEEQWGLYLEQHQIVPEKLQDFFSDIQQQAKNGELIKNPKYYVQQAMEANFMEIEPLEKAIKLNSKDFAPHYYAGRTIREWFIDEKVENLKGFHIANQINISTTEMNNSQIQEGLQEKKESKDSKIENFLTSNLQLQNQLKIYEQFINNIESIQEVLKKFDPNKEQISVEFENTKSVINEPELQSELDEIITDDAITKIGKVKKMKKKRRWWDSLLMIVLGGLQFIAGAAICAFSGGAATSIGVSLMIEGAKDIFQGVQAAWSGLPIDWGAWGQGKVISLSMTLALAGPTALSELGQGFKMMQKVPLLDILKSLPQTSMEGVLNGFTWVGAQFKGVLQNVADGFKGLKITDLVGNFQEVQQNLMDQVSGFIKTGQVPQNIGEWMKEIVGQALQNAGGKLFANDVFLKNLQKLGGPFLGYLVQKNVAKRTEQENKECIKQVTNQSSAQLQKQRTQIQEFIQQQKQLKEKLNTLNKDIPEFLQKDPDIKEVLGFAQIFFDCNYQKKEEQIAVISIDYFPQQLKEQIKKQEAKFKKEVEELNLENQQQLNQFYKNTLKQITLNSLNDLKQKIEDSNFVPLARPILSKYCEQRQSLQKELQSQQNEIQQFPTTLSTDKASLQQLFQTLESNPNRTQAQIDDYNRRQEQFQQKVEQFNEKTEQCQTRINQFNIQGQINPNDLTKPIKTVVNKLIELKLLEKDGVTPKQNVTIQQIQTKFQSLLKTELHADQQCIIDPLMEGFKFAQSQPQNRQKSDFLTSRLFDAIDDQIANFIVQKIFTDKLQGEANRIMQNIANGK